MTVTQESQSHILTVVVEDYFQVGAFRHLIPHGNWDRFESRLKHNTDAALELLDRTGNRATFFSSGWIADHHPQILRDIVESGHEVACLGYFHYSIAEITPADFARDIRRSRSAIEDVAGVAVQGFRTGRGWLGTADLWALDALAEAGFAYDSSLCRIGREFWNEPARSTVHQQPTPDGLLWEVPVSSTELLHRSVPICGGNYLRQFPDWSSRRKVRDWVENRADPMVLYFHLWELDPDQPRIAAASWLQQIRHYRNLTLMADKVAYYLERYRFTSVADKLQLQPDNDAFTRRQAGKRFAAAELTTTTAEPVPLTLVIPCYNEAATLPYLKRNLQRFARKAERLFRLSYIIVDDGSQDETATILAEQFADLNNCRIVSHPQNRGIAAAIITGFSCVDTDLLAVIDADCTFAPDQLMEMMTLLEEDVDVVVASPAHDQGAMRNVPIWRTLLSNGCAGLYRMILKQQLTSYTSCFRLYRRRSVDKLAVCNPGFSGVTEILGRLDLSGYRIVEYPAVLEVRLLGYSKINILQTSLDHLKLMVRLLRWRWFGKAIPERVSAERNLAVMDGTSER